VPLNFLENEKNSKEIHISNPIKLFSLKSQEISLLVAYKLQQRKSFPVFENLNLQRNK
jgi:hypothetical protein